MKRVTYLLVLTLALACAKPSLKPAGNDESSEHLLLGNPSAASTDETRPDNYLLVKDQFALSYNESRRGPNWVSWHLEKADLGSVDRQDDFRPDAQLPAGWYRVRPGDYTNSGFDRGHLCPSGDRKRTEADNSATFLMTNILPQAPEVNRESWAYIEEYCRDLVSAGYELYIASGGYGMGGTGSKGFARTVTNGVVVPERLWKVIVALPEGTGDLGRINAGTEVIVVDMPNSSAMKDVSWLSYLTTLTELENRTGLRHFLSNVSSSLLPVLKSKRFDLQKTSLPGEVKTRSYNGQVLRLGARGGCYFLDANGTKKYVDRSLCEN